MARNRASAMDRRNFLKATAAALAVGSAMGAMAATAKPNVLFIAIDDMNDWVGFLGGHPQTKTPNMDRLAKRGVNFRNTHCSAPGCSPSRNSLLFGVEPHNSGLYPFYDTDKIDPDVLAPYTTLPRLFKEQGYNTYGAGKIHHGTGWTYEKDGGAYEWTEHGYKRDGAKWVPLEYDVASGYSLGTVEKPNKKMSFCPTKNRDEDHPDFKTSQFGVDVLGRKHDKPFFLAVGIVKPHLAFVCPKRFFDMHAGPIEPPAIKSDDLSDIPWAGRSMAKLGDDFRYRKDKAWEKVRRAYLACISWTDFNVGRVLDALAASPYEDNTIIVLWSDHGYHQGEKRSFRKFSLWEEATHVPFIVYDPRMEAKQGRVCDEATSLIDIYPTLTDLAGLKKPDYVDGISLRPWLEDPSRPRKKPAITSWGRGNYAIRTRGWRYIRYFDGSEELYHNESDTNEWENLADSPEYAPKKKELAQWLPKNEAPLVLSGKALHSCVDADQPSLEKAKEFYQQTNAKVKPPLE